MQSSPATAATAAASTTTSTVSGGPSAVSSKSVPAASRRDVNQDVCNVPGFTVLQWLLSQHPHIPQVYFMMLALLVGQPIQQLPPDVQVSQSSCLSLALGLASQIFLILLGK